MMQMQAVTATILTAGIWITNEMDYDRLKPLFHEVVDLATLVAELRQRRNNDSTFGGGLWIDIGVTPQFYVVVTRPGYTAKGDKAIGIGVY